jgi:hypothetical protein
MDSFRFDPDQMIVGSVLRRALPRLWSTRQLHYDLHRTAALNDLVFGEITRVPSRPFSQLKYNFVERLYAHEERYRMAVEEITTRLGLRVCRSATRQGDRFIPDGRQLAAAVLAVTRGGGRDVPSHPHRVSAQCNRGHTA